MHLSPLILLGDLLRQTASPAQDPRAGCVNVRLEQHASGDFTVHPAPTTDPYVGANDPQAVKKWATYLSAKFAAERAAGSAALPPPPPAKPVYLLPSSDAEDTYYECYTPFADGTPKDKLLIAYPAYAAACGVARSVPARCPQCKREGFLHATWCSVGMDSPGVLASQPAQPQRHTRSELLAMFGADYTSEADVGRLAGCCAVCFDRRDCVDNVQCKANLSPLTRIAPDGDA